MCLNFCFYGITGGVGDNHTKTHTIIVIINKLIKRLRVAIKHHVCLTTILRIIERLKTVLRHYQRKLSGIALEIILQELQLICKLEAAVRSKNFELALHILVEMKLNLKHLHGSYTHTQHLLYIYLLLFEI